MGPVSLEINNSYVLQHTKNNKLHSVLLNLSAKRRKRTLGRFLPARQGQSGTKSIWNDYNNFINQ